MPASQDLLQPLTTERLCLTPATAAHQDDLLRLWTDPDVRRYLWDNRIINQETVSAICRESARLFLDLGVGLYVLAQRDQPDVLVGFCGLRRMQPAEQAANIELLYGMFPQYWGSGIITEAAQAVLRHGFVACDLPAIAAATDTPNQRSVRVMQRLGMSFVERREWRGLDTVFYAMSEQEFSQVHGGTEQARVASGAPGI